jgi:hypothetical protein
MPVKLNSSGGGSVTLDVPATATATSLIIPSNAGTMVTTGSTAAVTPAMLTQPLTLATVQNSTSGTFIDFTGIPSWAKRITVMFNGVSTNGTSPLILQIGTSSGFETSGYLSQTNTFDSGPGGVFATGSFALTSVNAAAYNWNGVIPICLIGSNLWVTSGVLMTASGSAATTIMAGSKTLAGTLDRLRIATVNGTDTFDAGTINIMYEG